MQEPCQDRLGAKLFHEKTFIAIVADGAGSAPRGGEGAELVVSAFLDHVSRALEDNEATLLDSNESFLEHTMRKALEGARSALENRASELNVPLRDLATTALAVVVSSHDGLAMQIGDGVIAVSEELNDWCPVLWPQHGEFINTTNFLTDDDAISKIESAPLKPSIQDICLSTDGLEALILNIADRTAHSPFFSPLFKELHARYETDEFKELEIMLERFINSERVRSRTSDDISIIIATRR
jgi:serine/threonine protein phosphatase PrpC